MRNKHLLFTPLWFSLPMTFVNIAIMAIVLPLEDAVIAALAGGVAAYLLFEWLHLTSHFRMSAKGRLGRYITRRHGKHHHVDYANWYTVSPGGQLVDQALRADPAEYRVVPNVRTCGLDPDDPRLLKSQTRFGFDASLANKPAPMGGVHAQQDRMNVVTEVWRALDRHGLAARARGSRFMCRPRAPPPRSLFRPSCRARHTRTRRSDGRRRKPTFAAGDRPAMTAGCGKTSSCAEICCLCVRRPACLRRWRSHAGVAQPRIEVAGGLLRERWGRFANSQLDTLGPMNTLFSLVEPEQRLSQADDQNDGILRCHLGRCLCARGPARATRSRDRRPVRVRRPGTGRRRARPHGRSGGGGSGLRYARPRLTGAHTFSAASAAGQRSCPRFGPNAELAAVDGISTEILQIGGELETTRADWRFSPRAFHASAR